VHCLWYGTDFRETVLFHTDVDAWEGQWKFLKVVEKCLNLFGFGIGVFVVQREGVRKRCLACKIIAHVGCAEQVWFIIYHLHELFSYFK